MTNKLGIMLKISITGVIKRQFFHMVTNVFDNNNLSQEIFAIETCGAVICSLGRFRKHMLMILRLYGDQASKPGLHIPIHIVGNARF